MTLPPVPTQVRGTALTGSGCRVWGALVFCGSAREETAGVGINVDGIEGGTELTTGAFGWCAFDRGVDVGVVDGRGVAS